MANRRTASRTALEDDRGVAAVVGFVLMLAAAVTYYSWAAQNDVPRVGAQNERAWDASVGAALSSLANGAAERAGTNAAVSEILPSAPEPPTQQIPFLAPLRSAQASGSVAYAEDCGGASLTHVTGGVTVVDLTLGGRGCLTFRGETAYAEPFAYRFELGGLLRIQGDKAAVISGPPLDVGSSRLALTLVELQGSSQTLGISANAPVTLAPLTGTLEVGNDANADSARWVFTTDHPEAWRDWYRERFSAGGVDATVTTSCANPTQNGPARGPCSVDVAVPDPTSLSISYGRYDVSLG